MAAPDRHPPKNRRINMRIDDQDRELFDQAATELRQSLTQFLLESGRERAERLLADRTHFVLDAAQWEELEEALDRPAQVKPELVALFTRPRPE